MFMQQVFFLENLLTTMFSSGLFLLQLENMLGDIGGQLGLWVGISVITVAEILELLLNIVMLLCRKLMR